MEVEKPPSFMTPNTVNGSVVDVALYWSVTEMGMFDEIQVKGVKCSMCGRELQSPFQTKSLFNELRQIHIGDYIGTDFAGRTIEAHTICDCGGKNKPGYEKVFISVTLEIDKDGVYNGRVIEVMCTEPETSEEDVFMNILLLERMVSRSI